MRHDCFDEVSQAPADGDAPAAAAETGDEFPGRAERPPQRVVRERVGRYIVESSPAWAAGDARAHSFYTYILKLSDSSYYVGQSRDLQPRFMEHRDGGAADTAGVVCAHARGAQAARLDVEAELKGLRGRNPHEIRRVISEFRNLVRDVYVDA